MNANISFNSFWGSVSFGDAANGSSMDWAGLGAHLDLCRGLHGRLFAVQCMAESVHGFLAARFVTTLVGLALLVGLISLVG